MDKFALTNAIYHMDTVYQKFFKEYADYPRFKSKHNNHKSYTTNKDLCITSAGRKYEDSKLLKKYERKLAELQRQLAHKEKSKLLQSQEKDNTVP